MAGQIFSEDIIERIGATVRNTADLSRCALSKLVCEWLNWKGPAGQAKDSSCRVALCKLEKLGVIELPAARPFYCPRATESRSGASMDTAEDSAIEAQWHQAGVGKWEQEVIGALAADDEGAPSVR